MSKLAWRGTTVAISSKETVVIVFSKGPNAEFHPFFCKFDSKK